MVYLQFSIVFQCLFYGHPQFFRHPYWHHHLQEERARGSWPGAARASSFWRVSITPLGAMERECISLKSFQLPSGKLSHNYGKSPFFFMGKSTISMAMFNSYVKLPEGIKGHKLFIPQSSLVASDFEIQIDHWPIPAPLRSGKSAVDSGQWTAYWVRGLSSFISGWWFGTCFPIYWE